MQSEEIIEMMKMTDNQELIELRKRNEERLAAAKLALGTKWLLHPDNVRKRIVESDRKR